MRVLLAAVAVWAATAGPAALAAEVEATLDWARRVELSTPVSGVVAEVAAEPGDAVAAGEALVRLDPRPLKAAARAAQARVDRTRPARDEAERELERSRELYERTLLSKHDLQVAEIEHAAADAALREAQAALEQARLDLEYSVVRAPFEAWVLERPAQVGQTVVTRLEARPLVVLAERGRMLARAAVAEVVAGELERGRQLEVVVDGRGYAGTVRTVGLEPVADGGETPRYPVTVVFSHDGAERLRAGGKAKVVLP
ncbi:MAG TPA: efflux RND transporter periplasmic adaptor subunit [Gammaproteobacteria bacterium]|nr:efflux RND transporter periplasmic adaptor subunit [Gammaproteobacteria bacterium]